MSNSNRLNVMDKLLITAFRLKQKRKSSFSAEDLVVSAWKSFPNTFGLRGYRNEKGELRYPDSNRVFAEIMGSKPIRKRGYLIRVGTKRYNITESGIEYAKFLVKQDYKSAPQKAALPREIENKLKNLLDSRAVRKKKENRESDITFFDACNFWKISPGSSSIEFKGSIKNLNNILSTVKNIAVNNPITFKHSGKVIDKKDIDFLEKLNEILLNKFSSELELIKKRKDERL